MYFVLIEKQVKCKIFIPLNWKKKSTAQLLKELNLKIKIKKQERDCTSAFKLSNFNFSQHSQHKLLQSYTFVSIFTTEII